MSFGLRIPLPNLRYVIVGALVLTLGTANIVLAGDKGSLVSIIDAITGTAAKVDAAGSLSVSVANFPATQNVAGTVNVANLPATQNVSGAVNVGNFPATQAVSGSVNVSTLPATVELFTNGSFIDVNAGELKALATLDVSHVDKIRVVAFNVGSNTAYFALSELASTGQLVALLDSFSVSPGTIEQRTYDLPGRSLILFVDQRSGGATRVQMTVWGR